MRNVKERIRNSPITNTFYDIYNTISEEIWKDSWNIFLNCPEFTAVEVIRDYSHELSTKE